MTIEKPAPWTGASGATYTFHVYGLEPGVPSRLGNYIYAKRNAEGAWVPLYMGHGDLAACRTDPALSRCIAAKGATHLHLRLNSMDADREAELRDLLAHYANAFAPEGCQPAPGAENADVSRQTTADSAAASKPATRGKAAKATPKKAVAKKAAPKKATTKKTAIKTPKSPRPRAR